MFTKETSISIGDIKMSEEIKNSEMPPTFEEMEKMYPFPEDKGKEIYERESNSIFIYRDEKVQEIIPVYGNEKSIYDYFSQDGRSGEMLNKNRYGGERIFAVSNEFYKMPSHDIKRIISMVEMTGAKIELFKLDGPIESCFLPKSGGEWESEKGDSMWVPDGGYIPLKNNPEGKTWSEIKKEFGIEGIIFKDGEPDFSPISEGTVEIEDFTEDRNANFTQADEKLAEKWTSENKDGKSWSPAEVKAYRKEHKLSWHERSDQKTMDLVPSIIHGNIPHSGGISEAKKEAGKND